MPNVETERTRAKYIASTSYSDTPPSGRQSITIGSEQKIKIAKWASEASNLPNTIAAGRSGLARSISYVLRSFSPVSEPAAKLGDIRAANKYCPKKKRLIS